VDHTLSRQSARNGGKIISLTRQPSLYPAPHKKHYFTASGTHFCWRLSKPQDLVRPEGLSKLIGIIHFIASLTRELPDCSTVLLATQPLQDMGGDKFQIKLKP
jgi:hypothetical protein